jgi:hypothetical protein
LVHEKVLKTNVFCKGCHDKDRTKVQEKGEAALSAAEEERVAAKVADPGMIWNSFKKRRS